MKKHMKRKNSGITLIALVVTIVVLLILAGISVQMLTGDNGILKRTGEARDTTVTKNLKEEIEMVIIQRQINRNIGQENKTVKEDIENGIRGITIEKIEGYTDVFYVQKDNGYVTVYEDEEIQEGKVEIWDGKKISCPEFKKENNIWNWYIYTPAQFKFFADYINNGNSLTGTIDLTNYVKTAGYNPEDVTIERKKTVVYLMNNLDMGARQGEGDTLEQKWETEINKKIKWTPIGSEYQHWNSEQSKFFLGKFEGNNNIIRGIYVNESDTNKMCGIFGGLVYRIENLTIKNSYVKGKSVTGGIAVLSEYLINCKNINSIVISLDSEAGGISAVSWGTLISDCSNYGIVIGVDVVGGITAEINTMSTKIINCSNYGDIHVMKNNQSVGGGIIGRIYDNSHEIKGCKNYGKITGVESTSTYSSIGGIVAWVQDDATLTITECENNVEIDVVQNNVGGIVGQAKNITITNCKNNGAILAPGFKQIGGIIGRITQAGTLTGCINNGDISGKENVDGIVGDGKNLCTIEECINNGQVNIVDKQ